VDKFFIRANVTETTNVSLVDGLSGDIAALHIRGVPNDSHCTTKFSHRTVANNA